LSVLLLISASHPSMIQAKIEEDLVRGLKKTVVNLEIARSFALNRDQIGVTFGTGFIVEAKKGLIATNRHVSGSSPCQAKVTFENGETAEALLIHYDFFHDFSFFKINPTEIEFKLNEIKIGNSNSLKEQDEVFLIGNNEKEEYSVKFGRVTNLVVDKGDRHSATFQTSFDRTGGSSGSPVFNATGEVVGIHYKGTNTTSFELRIEYLRDALTKIKSGEKISRGEPGFELDLMNISDAVKHFHLPEKEAKRVQALRKDIKRIIYIDRIIPESRAMGIFHPGDIVVELDGRLMGDDLYAFDLLLNSKVDSEVPITVFRNGKKLIFNIFVEDCEKNKVRRFASFAGGVFHDLNPELRRSFEINGTGTYLSQANRGTSMAHLGFGTSKQPTDFVVVVEGINGMPTPDLDAFIAAAASLKNHDRIYILVRNFRSYRTSLNAKTITLELKYHPLKVFKFNATKHEWMVEKLPGTGGK
ncbi:trypsin-like peptidase domain-containing protein, partial [Candidatus Riflebacteria bacterium]